MDLGNIVYIIAVIGYFIYQATKKKRGQELPGAPDSNPEPPQKGMTFEELLKEIRQAQNPIPAPPTPKPQPIPVSTQRNPYRKPTVIQEEEDDEIQYYEGTFDSTKKNPYQEYAEKHSIPAVPIQKINYDELNTKRVNRYAEKLKNPQSVREAIVLSEILKRKHF